MDKGSVFFIGCIVGALAMAISMHFVLESKSELFPEPDGRVTVNDEDWRWYDTNPDKVGPSPKCWVNRHGVIYEPSGVKFPKWGETKQENQSE